MQLKKEDFIDKVAKAEGKVLVEFGASWCGPCQAMKPIIAEVAKEHTVYEVDIDDESELAERYGVDGIPCLIVFEQGNEVARTVGVQPKARILEMLK